MSEITVTQMACSRIPTAGGQFRLYLYVNSLDDKEHMAIVHGDVAGRQNVLVRIHSECFTGDILGSLRCDCGTQLEEAINLIAKEEAGVLIYLRQEGRGIGLLDKLRAYNLQDQGYDTVDANLMLGHGADERDYTVAALILKQLGAQSVRLLTNNPLKIDSLQASGVKVTTRVPIRSHVTAENAAYLLTKAQRMNHTLNLDSLSAALKGNGNGHGHDRQSSQMHPESFPAETDEHLEVLLQRIAGHRERTGRPFVTLSYAQSLDGCIASLPGQPLNLSGRQSLVLTHRLRAAHDAILIGIGTVLSDNPQLTVRLVEGKSPQPVVADSRLRFPLDANLLRERPLPLLIATCQGADPERQRALEEAGAQILRLPAGADGRVGLPVLLERLGELNINSLMVEGGARIITSFLSARLVDHLILTVAPKLIGGMRGIRRLAQTGPAGFPHLRNLRHQWLEEDMVLWGDPIWEKP
ncbi:MAG TPA: GTP cyclohydrolase II [Pyrinomonadaceae bacterium]|jgi:3,4-dihydroxy 2-butanone 4-phosphate synthase/GTP cyclohydrolase II